VKLLFDANISRKIVRMIEDLFPGSTQIRLLGFSGQTADEAIWEYAKNQAFTIVTSDVDFVRLSGRFGPPPKVIRLDRMDYSTGIAAELIRRHSIIISEFGKSTNGVLVLRRPAK
jgi:predicted nuclease of predicted toxin-antitoxin system